MSQPFTIQGASRLAAALAAGALGLQAGAAAAQPAPYFSPTYAASEGSPYKEVYGRTFGAGGPPPQTPARTAQLPAAMGPLPGAPLETAAPAPDQDVVYVIENGRLLTFRAEDYATGEGQAQALSPLSNSSSPLGLPEPQLPTIANRLYGPPPAETAAGPAAPIPLAPPSD